MRCCQLVAVIVSRDYVEMWYGLYPIRELENELYLKGKCIKEFQFHTFTVFLVGPSRLYIIISSEESSMAFWVIWENSAMCCAVDHMSSNLLKSWCISLKTHIYLYVLVCSMVFLCYHPSVSTRELENWALVHFGIVFLITLPNFMHLIHIQHSCCKGY